MCWSEVVRQDRTHVGLPNCALTHLRMIVCSMRITHILVRARHQLSRGGQHRSRSTQVEHSNAGGSCAGTWGVDAAGSESPWLWLGVGHVKGFARQTTRFARVSRELSGRLLCRHGHRRCMRYLLAGGRAMILADKKHDEEGHGGAVRRPSSTDSAQSMDGPRLKSRSRSRFGPETSVHRS